MEINTEFVCVQLEYGLKLLRNAELAASNFANQDVLYNVTTFS